ncbi:MAG: hypothetical protein NC225_07020 [Clostridium sp.]|nr:hypothetical protein [Clostridium sp.]MCM1399221.1 hypothetical protein [Clostridium sp.]MCM1459243.1 hypothetical protein [Bacteroides sp.]
MAEKKNPYKNSRWDKLDNTANLFPVIVSEDVSNVYRVSVTLKEEIDGDILQQALDKVLPYFDVFQTKLKKGVFWYYFETNSKEAPRVHQEDRYPCAYINPYINNEYQFRVTHYKKRINLEVFHVVTDGNGALMFLKELTYQYLRYKYPVLEEAEGDNLKPETSLDREDSYLKNYTRSAKKGYKTEKAYIVNGEYFDSGCFGITHGYVNLPQLKSVCKSYGVTINQYLISLFIYSVYKEYLKSQPCENPISVCVPVNLRPYFDSNTTKNFFAVVSAVFKATKESYTFPDVLREVSEGLKEQINKESLEKLFSYNVSNEKSTMIRAVPLFIKSIVMKIIYKTSARANTATITNLGKIDVSGAYREYIDKFHVVLSMSKGQNIKGGVCTYGDTLVFTFSSAVRETYIQKCFFRHMVEEGIEVSVETNGVYYE